MAIWAQSEAEPSTTPAVSFYRLESMGDDSQSWEPPASPEGLSEPFDYHDFGDHQQPPKRSPTYPFVPPGPSEAHILKSLGKSSNVYHTYAKRGIVPPVPKRIVHTTPNLSGPHSLRHSSTIDTNNSESFEETAVWDQKAILSLDGGGIRGYSALLILQALMKAIGKIEGKPASGWGKAKSSYHPLSPLSPAPPMATDINSTARHDEPVTTESSPWLPCHYFDYVAGTSTGGLIGIMLGRLRMNVDECISEYETLGAEVFGHPRKFHIRSLLFWPRDKYNYKTPENVVRDVVRRRVPKVAEFPGGRNFRFYENGCRTVVVAYQQQSKVGVEKPYLFRTYKNLHKSEDLERRTGARNPDMAHDIPIWQVARATSAAPTYFKPPVIDGLEYVDGGFGANNPCAEIYNEVLVMNNNSKECASIILSIGTGRNNEARRFKGTGFQRYLNYLKFARKWASDSEETHEVMLKESGRGGSLKYFRLNVEEGLDLMKLDEWRARGPVRTKIGKRIGAFRSYWRKDQCKDTKFDGAGAVSDKRDNVLDEKYGHLQNGSSTTDMNGNGNMDHTGQQALGEPSEQAPARTHALNGAATTSTAHLEHIVSGATTSGHLPATGISARQFDSDVDNTRIPSWFRPKNTTLESIRGYTEKYLSRPETIEMIEQCAKLLVEGRRGRAKNLPRWEKVCFDTWYQCRIWECPRGEKEYDQEKQFRKHLLDKHKAAFPDLGSAEGKRKLENELNSCKTVVH